MRHGVVVAIAGIAMSLMQGAVAESAVQLDQAEIQSVLLGTKLTGDVDRSGVEWRGCIEPDGDAVNQIDGVRQRGRLDVTEDGRACFSYEGTNPKCFIVYQTGQGLLLHSSFDLYVHKIETGIESCSG